MNIIKVDILRRVSVQIEASHYTPRRRLGAEEALGGVSGQRHAPAALYPPWERTPGTYCTGGWVGRRAGLNTEARVKILSPLPGIEPQSPGRPDRSHALYRQWSSLLALNCRGTGRAKYQAGLP
jgi:hypothetical protein